MGAPRRTRAHFASDSLLGLVTTASSEGVNWLSDIWEEWDKWDEWERVSPQHLSLSENGTPGQKALLAPNTIGGSGFGDGVAVMVIGASTPFFGSLRESRR